MKRVSAAARLTRRMKAVLVLLALSGTLAAQGRARPRGYWKHHVTGAMGAGLPRGELRPFFGDSFGLNFGYGYRFHRNFQADTGLDTVFHAARVRDFFQSQFGDLRIRDYQFMVPVGGRAILAVLGGRLQFHGGGGAAYVRYQERIRQPFGDAYFRLECRVCRSRSGWGHYGLLGTSVALDRYQHFRLGVATKVYRAGTGGDAFGTLPAFHTRDRWVNVFGEFGLSF
jgi:hypothetical protein